MTNRSTVTTVTESQYYSEGGDGHARTPSGNRLGLLLALTLVGATQFVVTAAAASNPAKSRSIHAVVGSDRDIANEIRIRKSLHLRADEEYVRTVSEANPRYLMIPLTPTEEAEMQRSGDLGAMIADVDKAMMAKYPDLYGGARIDQARGGALVIALTRPSSDVERDVASLLPADAQLVVEQAAASLRSLSELHARIDSDYLRLRAQGYNLQSLENAYPRAVVLGIAANSPSSAEAELRQHFGDPGVLLEIVRVNKKNSDL